MEKSNFLKKLNQSLQDKVVNIEVNDLYFNILDGANIHAPMSDNKLPEIDGIVLKNDEKEKLIKDLKEYNEYLTDINEFIGEKDAVTMVTEEVKDNVKKIKIGIDKVVKDQTIKSNTATIKRLEDENLVYEKALLTNKKIIEFLKKEME